MNKMMLPQTNKGFTLVEIAIVIVIVGVVIGATLVGFQLIENSRIARTGNNLTAIDNAGTIFKDSYKHLPGDLGNPTAILPNCNTPPCSRGGNQNRILGTTNVFDTTEALTVTNEKFVFWHHLVAADLLTDIPNIDNMNFGQGQPAAPIGGGFRMVGHLNLVTVADYVIDAHSIRIANVPIDIRSSAPISDVWPYSCSLIKKLDEKFDNGMPRTGKITADAVCLLVPTDVLSGFAASEQKTGSSFHLSF
jgi:prepilin-type N-terminal cleavage/methylation domain-containing protein